MPITETEWKEHHQKFGTQSIETMSIKDYRRALLEEAFSGMNHTVLSFIPFPENGSSQTLSNLTPNGALRKLQRFITSTYQWMRREIAVL